MMKKLYAKPVAALLVTALGLLVGCNNPLDRSATVFPGAGVALVSLAVAGENPPNFSARTVLPLASSFYYTLVFTNGTKSKTKCLDKAASMGVSLDPGPWSITVEGFSDSGRSAKALDGSASVNVVSGQTASVTVPLSETPGAPTGHGSIAYTITIPASGMSVGTLILTKYLDSAPYKTINILANDTDASDNVVANYVNGSAAGTISPIPAGYYQVLVKLFNNGSRIQAGYTDLVHVYGNGALTTITKEFTNDNFFSYAMVDARDLSGLVTAPLIGAAPDATAISHAQYTGTIAWRQSNGTTNVTGNFAVDTVYKAIVRLTAVPGYTFVGLGQDVFSYSGATAVENPAGAGQTVDVTITFPATAAAGP
jgi:hypothetical protein